MMNTFFLLFLLLASLPVRAQETSDAVIKLTGSEPVVVAVPDMRGNGDAQAQMNTLNGTLFADLQDAGVFRMAPKSAYPLEVPQRPQDFKAPVNGQRTGPWLTDWSADPVNATYLTVGYAAVQEGRLVLYGWLFNVKQPDIRNAQAFGKLYFADLNEEGARRVAHEFAADILANLGFKGLFGSRIYYTNTRGRGDRQTKEIWVMDWDGANKRQLTHHGSISSFAAVAPDGSRLAYTSYAKGQPQIMMMSLETGRILPFFNPRATLVSLPEFTSDGRLIFASTAGGGMTQLYTANVDGGNLKRLTNSRAIDVEAKVNPKTGSDIVFVSGRSGIQQIYSMSMDGGGEAARLTNGEGQAANPSWHPDGQVIAFAWTKGYDPGNFNVFLMDVATRKFQQLTRQAGRNENPSWAPDGRHVVFSSDRSGSMQIWTMLADGTQLRQLTTEGRNGNPVWSAR